MSYYRPPAWRAWLVAAVACVVLGVVLWRYASHVTETRVAQRAAQQLQAAHDAAEVLQLQAHVAAQRADSLGVVATTARARFVRDSTASLGKIRALLAQLADTTGPGKPVIPPAVQTGLQQCVELVSSCALAQAADSARIAALEDQLATAQRQLDQANRALEQHARARSVEQLQRASARTWRDVKVGAVGVLGGTLLGAAIARK